MSDEIHRMLGELIAGQAARGEQMARMESKAAEFRKCVRVSLFDLNKTVTQNRAYMNAGWAALGLALALVGLVIAGAR